MVLFYFFINNLESGEEAKFTDVAKLFRVLKTKGDYQEWEITRQALFSTADNCFSNNRDRFNTAPKLYRVSVKES